MMRSTSRPTRWSMAFGGVLVVAVLALAPGCARKYQAESNGKDVGQALCDVRDASNADEAQKALSEFNAELDDLANDFATFTAEDRRDIQEQVSDLSKHVGDQALAQQDITVIRRSVENIKDDLSDTGQAAIDGIFEGLDDCEDG